MGFSISPTRVIEILLERKLEKKKETIEYLDSIASDARILADIWHDLYDRLISNDLNSNYRALIEKKFNNILYVDVPYTMTVAESRKADYGIAANVRVYCRLCEFYKLLSTALGGHLDTRWIDEILNCIGGIICQRNITKESYKEIISNTKNPFFIDTRNTYDKITNLAKSVEALHAEAAALDVLVKTVKSSNLLT